MFVNLSVYTNVYKTILILSCNSQFLVSSTVEIWWQSGNRINLLFLTHTKFLDPLLVCEVCCFQKIPGILQEFSHFISTHKPLEEKKKILNTIK
jgi:hypothetical protein